jgi:hypothetical protein
MYAMTNEYLYKILPELRKIEDLGQKRTFYEPLVGPGGAMKPFPERYREVAQRFEGTTCACLEVLRAFEDLVNQPVVTFNQSSVIVRSGAHMWRALRHKEPTLS